MESANETHEPLPLTFDLKKVGLVGLVQLMPALSPNTQKLLLNCEYTFPPPKTAVINIKAQKNFFITIKLRKKLIAIKKTITINLNSHQYFSVVCF